MRRPPKKDDIDTCAAVGLLEELSSAVRAGGLTGSSLNRTVGSYIHCRDFIPALSTGRNADRQSGGSVRQCPELHGTEVPMRRLPTRLRLIRNKWQREESQ